MPKTAKARKPRRRNTHKDFKTFVERRRKAKSWDSLVASYEGEERFKGKDAKAVGQSLKQMEKYVEGKTGQKFPPLLRENQPEWTELGELMAA